MTDPEAELARDPELRAGVARLLGELFAQADREEAELPHVLLAFDPETGRQHAVGPFRSRFEARIAAVIVAERYRQAELDDVRLTPIPLEPFDGKGADVR